MNSRVPRSPSIHITMLWGKDPSTALSRDTPVWLETVQLLCVSALSACAYPGKTHHPGNPTRGASAGELRAATVVSGYLPSCPVQAQHGESTASPPCGTQPCLDTCTPLGPLVSAVPSEAPCASADTGQQRRSLAPLNVPMGVRGSFHSLVQLAARLAVGIGLIQGGRQICRGKTTQPSVALGISCKDKIYIYMCE